MIVSSQLERIRLSNHKYGNHIVNNKQKSRVFHCDLMRNTNRRASDQRAFKRNGKCPTMANQISKKCAFLFSNVQEYIPYLMLTHPTHIIGLSVRRFFFLSSSMFPQFLFSVVHSFNSRRNICDGRSHPLKIHDGRVRKRKRKRWTQRKNGKEQQKIIFQ